MNRSLVESASLLIAMCETSNRNTMMGGGALPLEAERLKGWDV